jgi:hypothetical protein
VEEKPDIHGERKGEGGEEIISDFSYQRSTFRLVLVGADKIIHKCQRVINALDQLKNKVNARCVT